VITISAPPKFDYYPALAYIVDELVAWVRLRYPEQIADEILRDGQIIVYWADPSYCGTLYPHSPTAHRVTDRATSQSFAGMGTNQPYQV
jgi:hypothetical protein